MTTPDPASPVNVSTKRTAVNITTVGLIIYAVSYVTGKEISIDPDDPINLLLVPAIGVVGGIGYRLSRWATNRWPSLGWVLFGSGKEPAGLKPIA